MTISDERLKELIELGEEWAAELFTWRNLGREIIEWNNDSPDDMGLSWSFEKRIRELLK